MSPGLFGNSKHCRRRAPVLCAPFFVSKAPTEKQNNPQPFRRFALYGFFLHLDVKMEI